MYEIFNGVIRVAINAGCNYSTRVLSITNHDTDRVPNKVETCFFHIPTCYNDSNKIFVILLIV